MPSPSEVTFLIPVFNLKQDRIDNLKFIIPYIQKTGCRILVVEQTDLDSSELSPHLKVFPYVEHVLFKTPEKRFHKTAIINHGVFNYANTKHVWVNDADFYMNFEKVFEFGWNSEFIQPYEVAKKLNPIDSRMLLSGKKLDVDFTDGRVKYISLYGALSFIFDLRAFIAIGGMDESIYGWGYEDVELSKRVREKFIVQKINIRGIHLWHPVTDANTEEYVFDVNEYFDKIYCLNLKERTDRWFSVEKEFLSKKIIVHRVEAVTENEVTDEQFESVNPENISGHSASINGIIENKRALACLLSHLKIIKDAQKNNYDRILIFEDDVFLSKDFNENIKKIKGIDWKLMYLGGSQFDWTAINSTDHFYFAKNTYGTFAYAIQRSAYAEIIEALSFPKKSVDNILIQLQRRWEGKCFVFYPNIAISEVRDSDIRDAQDLNKYALAVRWNLNNFVISSTKNKKIKFYDGIQNLSELDRIFLKKNTEYWISCGTLLGFHRGDGFISHDTDIDICVNINGLNKELLDDIIKNGFKIIKKFGRISAGFQLSIFKRDIKVDLFFFYKKDGWGYHSVYSNFSEFDCLRHDYIFTNFDLTEKNYFGHIFVVPKNTEKYLVEQYGENYRDKEVEWDYSRSPKNIVHTSERVKYVDTDYDLENIIYKELNENVTILIKSFMREECVGRLIKSIRKQYRFIKIIVVDDSKSKLNFDFDENVKTYNIPFDSGLSAGRNYGVSKINTPYFILLDDDFVFTEHTDLLVWFDMMKKSKLDLLGGDVILDNNKTMFFGNLNRTGATLVYDCNTHSECGDYKTCDIVLNFFIAKTEKIKECPWNENLKLAEHTAYFLKYKDILKVGYTEKISIIHQQKREENYNEYRNRARMFLLNWMKESGIRKIINFENTVTEIVDGELKVVQMSGVNKKYWDNFYNMQSPPIDESNFAKFVLSYIIKNKIYGNMVDVGCGNGRDLMFFLRNKINAVGIDTSSVSANNNILRKNALSFSYANYTIIYLRFVVHTLRESELDILLNHIKKTTKSSFIFIETRSVFGISMDEKMETNFKSPIGDKHFRMLYSEKYLTKKLSKLFEVTYVSESSGVAVYEGEDPVCIRYILRNKID